MMELTPLERAAVLLMALGEDVSVEVLRELDPKEMRVLARTMSDLPRMSREDVEVILDSFLHELEHGAAVGGQSDGYVRKLFTSALGEQSPALVDLILAGVDSKGLVEILYRMDARAVADLIAQEHPQIIAIVLAYLDSEKAGSVLSALPSSLRPEVVLRLATLDGVSPSAFQELNQVLEARFAGNSDDQLQSSKIGGVRTAAEILNFVDKGVEQDIFDEISKVDEALTHKIQENMLLFEDLLNLDDRSMQILLREVSNEILLLGLKGADPAIQQKVFANMSARAGEMLREDMEVRGPVRVTEVESAQREIVAVARRLSEEGTISLGDPGESYV